MNLLESLMMKSLMQSVMRKFLVLGFLIFGSLTHAQDYKIPWCNTVGQVLKSYEAQAYAQVTYELELKTLQEGIEKALTLTNPKFHYYFRTTLLLSKNVLNFYDNTPTTTQDQVLFLRDAIRYAISDLTYFDMYLWKCNASGGYCNEGDHRNFVINLVHRGQQIALNAKTEVQEKLILQYYADAARQILEESQGQRAYYCSIQAFSAMKSMDQVFLLRSQMYLALERLTNYKIWNKCQ